MFKLIDKKIISLLRRLSLRNWPLVNFSKYTIFYGNSTKESVIQRTKCPHAPNSINYVLFYSSLLDANGTEILQKVISHRQIIQFFLPKGPILGHVKAGNLIKLQPLMTNCSTKFQLTPLHT